MTTEYKEWEENKMSKIASDCKLYEMVQYQCEPNLDHLECTPFVRLFLRCTGAPTVEVTPEYDQDGNPISRYDIQ
ncbi:uncharacterized protein BX663DRAFT_504974 [Cokeromyces recurvatus]|uniref:uncharacterized protein n=1 Tax=Cokeromyces recurvatus TaxID=90255 RepID=UPI00221FFFF2|nr:uncharacterized protein BX663DRAFT_504974 [Cokeromyces recurvatus]KAI7904412.1 hypothetical protein BX663DRAFT_504974 [Cokeromyces recurvatus]